MIAQRVTTRIEPRKTLAVKAGVVIPNIRYVRAESEIIDCQTMDVTRYKTVNLAKAAVRLMLAEKHIKLGELVKINFDSARDKRQQLARLHQALNNRNKQK